MRRFILFIFFSFVAFQLNAKTEIDKAFRKRTKSPITKFILYSPDIYDNKQIREEQVFNGFGCNGKNISPKLVWRNPPKNTKSFAITMYNKDTKSESGWWHWVIYNIPAKTTLIETGASEAKKLMPKGAIQVLNDYGFKGYGGVCPPQGSKHNYIITIYALNVEELNLPKDVMPSMVSYYLNEHKIATATIKAFYKRNFTITYNKENTSKEGKKEYKLKQTQQTQQKNKKSNLNKNKTSKNKQNNLKSNKNTKEKNIIIEEN